MAREYLGTDPATGEDRWSEEACEHGKGVSDCQICSPAATTLSGFEFVNDGTFEELSKVVETHGASPVPLEVEEDNAGDERPAAEPDAHQSGASERQAESSASSNVEGE